MKTTNCVRATITAICLLAITTNAFDWSQLLTINTGNPPGHNGDSPYQVEVKCNANFVLLGGLIAALQTITGTNLQVSATNGAPGGAAAVTMTTNGGLLFTIPAGLPGTNGVNGTNGTNGINGTNGVNGLNGTNGAPGATGATGATGAAGINGTNGVNGLNGTNGATGPVGPMGPAGINGTNGLNGINGTNGLNGTSLTNATATATNVLAGGNATVTVLVTNGNTVGFVFGLPAGAMGPPATNAIYPTPISTLFDTNPIVFSGSNFLGHFTNVYSYALNTPQVGSTGPTDPGGSNEVENLYASYDNTNYFQVTNNPCSFWTNIYLSVVGASATNAGEVVLYTMQNYGYAGLTYDVRGNVFLVADGGSGTTAVNYETMAQFVAGYYGANVWAASGNGVAYSPFGSNICYLAAGKTTQSTNLSFASSGTNWILSVATTNQVAGAIVQAGTNLALPSSGFFNFSPALYTVSTNSGKISYTIPKANCSANYEWFRIPALQMATMIVTPPLILQNGLVFVANTITSATNSTLGYGAGMVACDTNYIYVSIATNLWRRIAIPTNSW